MQASTAQASTASRPLWTPRQALPEAGDLAAPGALAHALEVRASSDREIIFTTVMMDRAHHQLAMLRQWSGNLRNAAAHALIIGMDHRTCSLVCHASRACIVD